MDRRVLLSTAGNAFVIGTAGCTGLLSDDSDHRLWFLRVRNNTPDTIDLGIRIYRDGTAAFEQRYDDVVGFEATDRDEAAPFGTAANARLVLPTWDDEAAAFEIEYTYTGSDGWERLDFADPDTRDIGIDLSVLGGRTGRDVNYRIVEFESSERPRRFVRRAANRPRNGSGER